MTPVAQGKAQVLALFAFPRERSWERRLAAAERSANALESHASTPLGYQVLGMLTLHAALAASVLHRHGAAAGWLDEAAGLARRVPDDMRGNWQYFSATNVAIWRLVINVERGDSGATLHLARAVRPENLTVRSRAADFLAETGRGLAREQRTRAEGVTWLRRAEETAPQWVRNSAAIRETVGYRPSDEMVELTATTAIGPTAGTCYAPSDQGRTTSRPGSEGRQGREPEAARQQIAHHICMVAWILITSGAEQRHLSAHQPVARVDRL